MPLSNKKTMQIHNNILITECSAYDFKEMLERKKVKSWLKSVSAFANTDGGSLFYGVNDDGVIVGLENPQADADFISEMIKARLDPVPEVQLIPIEHEGHTLLEVKVKTGTLTPYYYYQDGTRTAYIRIGNESVECNSQQLLSLVLKGTHMTWDSLPTQVDASKHSFIILANTFREQTHQEWNDKYLESFGLVTPDDKLTNAGLLFVDNCTVFQSRIFCTRWTGLYKDDAISSVEHRANLVLLLKYGMDFIKNYTMSGWVKMPNYRLNLPDYSDRAIFEGLVNHLIHRDYTMMGGEVHIDIYDDRVELVSPGAMLDGTQIQDRDIYKVPSMRRNPVIADMFTQLDYMEKLGVVGFEPGGRGLKDRVKEIKEALTGRDIKVSAICAGFEGFILSTDPAIRQKCMDTMKEIITAAGELGSTGVIIVPAFNGQVPALPHNQETRDFLCEQFTEMGNHAAQNGTTVIFEPLNRKECFYMRQVADAASVCRDINNPGVRCMGDFWHMTWEETSDMGAFISGGDYLQHVHVASRKRRSMPGEDGEADNYVDGFKGLKMLGYDKYVSFECGCQGDRNIVVPAAVELLRKQWEEA